MIECLANAEEFKIDGFVASRIPGKEKNRDSTAALLSWNTTPVPSVSSSKPMPTTSTQSQNTVAPRSIAPVTSTTGDVAYFSPTQLQMAGKAHLSTEHDGFSHKAVRWDKFKARDYGVVAPFGTETATHDRGDWSTMSASSASQTPRPSGSVTSLADLMKKKTQL